MLTCPETFSNSGRIAAPFPPASNGDDLPRLPASLPAFPPDAVARIERLARSATTSAPGEPQAWRLVFERRSPPFVDPLMGWTGGRDPLAALDLTFPTLEAAIGYATRQGLAYVVRHDGPSRRASERRARQRRAFSDMLLRRLGLRRLEGTYGLAMANADATPAPPGEPGAQPSAMDVVRDPNLSVDDKRSILMNRAFDAYLLDEHAGEGGQTRWARLDEIDQALLALERRPGMVKEDGAGAA